MRRLLPSIVPVHALACLLLGLCGLPTPAAAQSDDTVVKLERQGRIVLGARDAEMPLSYLDASGRHVGYHIDICQRIVTAIRQRFDLPNLQVATVPTTQASRFALLDNQTIDIDCGHNAVNPTALRQALLSHATLAVDVRLMTTAGRADQGLASLDGRRIGVIVGSSAVPALRSLARNAAMQPTEVFGRNPADTFALLRNGRVDAVAFSMPYLLAQRALSGEPKRYVLGPVLRSEAVSLMFRLGDERLHALANEVLDAMMRSGELAQIYERWFTQPIPGLPAALGLPISPATQELFDDPGREMLKM